MVISTPVRGRSFGLLNRKPVVRIHPGVPSFQIEAASRYGRGLLWRSGGSFEREDDWLTLLSFAYLVRMVLGS